MKRMLFSILLMLAGCGTSYVDVVTFEGAIIDIDSACFEFPDSAIMDSVVVEIEKHNVSRKTYIQGYSMTGTSYTIEPFDLGLEKPIEFSVPVESQNLMFGAKIAKGFVPLANSYVAGDTLYAQLWHGGEYYVIQRPDKYGIINHVDVENALLVVTDPYVSDYVKSFACALGQNGYEFPVWIYVYDLAKSVEENAYYLADELKKLHEQYGKFRLDIVSFGIGGLVLHRYVADTAMYQRDISSSVLAIGTSFKGSDLGTLENLKQAQSPYRYFYMDVLADRVQDIAPESDFITWVRKNRQIVGGYYYNDLEENKNFASIRGRSLFKGQLPEETNGDGLVSLESAMLTAIEPEPLFLDHFALYENQTAHEYIADFTKLYRTFNWPLLFDKVWRDEISMTEVSDIWEHEARLNYGEVGLGLLLQWNENMLNSTPSNAILVTNGDNDTYPAWYLQEKGIRNDIIIVNRSLLNVKDYALYLQRHKSLPLNMTAEELENIKYKKENGEFITISEQLIRLLINNGENPLVFSTTVYNPEAFGCPLKLVGVVYEIEKGDSKVDGKYVDIEKTWDLFTETFKFDRFQAADSISTLVRNMYMNFAGSLFMVHQALMQQEQYEAALEVLQYVRKLKPGDETVVMVYFNEALTYWKMGRFKEADSLFQRILETPNAKISFKKKIAEMYYEKGSTEQAIRILADCLKKEPDNKEILRLIEQFQEGL